MAAAVRYVKKREGVYQYVRRVPQAVVDRPAQHHAHFGGQSLFRRSLKTKDQGTAYGMAEDVEREFDELVARALGRLIPVYTAKAKAPSKIVTQADLDSIVARYRDLTLRPFKQAYLKADSNSVAADDWARLCDQFDTNAASIRAALEPGAREGAVETPAEVARWVVNHYDYDAPEGSEAFGQITGAIRAGTLQGYNDVANLRDGTAALVLPTSATKAAKKAPMTLSGIVDQYIKAKGFGPKTESETRKALSLFVALKGDQPISGLTRRDFQDLAENLGNTVIGTKGEGAIVRHTSEQTIRKRIGSLNAAITFAIDRGWYDGSNPAAGIKIAAFAKKADKSITPDKRPFKVSELNKVLQHPWFTGCRSARDTHSPGRHRLAGAKYWVPIVALYSGCRVSELGGLCVSEVLIDDPFPHFVIRPNKHRSIKNGDMRDVPILDALFALGFKEYVTKVRKTGAELLFPDWTPAGGKAGGWANSPLIRAFNRTVIPNMLAGVLLPGARTEVTFHNLRGSFKTMLTLSPAHLNVNVINEVVGHEKDDLDRRYVGRIPIDQTYPAVAGCDYMGLVVPRLG